MVFVFHISYCCLSLKWILDSGWPHTPKTCGHVARHRLAWTWSTSQLRQFHWGNYDKPIWGKMRFTHDYGILWLFWIGKLMANHDQLTWTHINWWFLGSPIFRQTPNASGKPWAARPSRRLPTGDLNHLGCSWSYGYKHALVLQIPFEKVLRPQKQL